MLQLSRPLAIFDLETTGVNVSTDRIIEIAIVKILAGGAKSIKKLVLNPQIPIPPSATEVHGFTDEMVKNEKTFKEVGHDIKQFLDGCDLGGFNSNKFDIPMLMEEFLRAEISFEMKGRKLVDAQKIFFQMEQRTLTAAYKFYCNKMLENSHSALADAEATYEVLISQLERYPELGNTVDSIHAAMGEENTIDYARRFVMENGVETFNFGKYKGKPLTEIFKTDPSYYNWIQNGQFPLDTKEKLKELWTKYKMSPTH